MQVLSSMFALGCWLCNATSVHVCLCAIKHHTPDSKVHGANMGPIWGRQDPGGLQVGPMSFAIWDVIKYSSLGSKVILLNVYHIIIVHLRVALRCYIQYLCISGGSFDMVDFTLFEESHFFIVNNYVFAVTLSFKKKCRIVLVISPKMILDDFSSRWIPGEFLTIHHRHSRYLPLMTLR